ncbi:MAG: dockerin type I repeat-containing protein [Ruminococcus sp.]|nr:dockerin type I repeat-containing protein [Ruminococcus sp.]
MKKIISFFIVFCMLVTALAATASAEVKLPDSFRYKYTEKLENKLLTMQVDDEMNLIIWLSYDADEHYGVSESDYANVEEYKAAITQAAKLFHTGMNGQYLEEIAQTVDFEIVYISKFSPMILIRAKASETPKLVALEQVAGIDWNDTPSAPLPEPTEVADPYEAKFSSWIKLPKYDPLYMTDAYGTYDGFKALYYHTSVQGAAPDWVLVGAHVEMYDPWEKIEYKQLGSRVLISWTPGAAAMPFELAIYETASDSFYDINSYSETVTEERFPGLSTAVASLGLGYELGDADADGEVGIVDATIIQRFKAGMRTPVEDIYQPLIPVLGDVDGGGLDITDATVIQRRLVGLI